MNETIEKARNYATATLGHEGKKPSESAVEITSDEAVRRIKQLYRR